MDLRFSPTMVGTTTFLRVLQDIKTTATQQHRAASLSVFSRVRVVLFLGNCLDYVSASFGAAPGVRLTNRSETPEDPKQYN